MAQVACCPQCNHDLLVPDDADRSSWAKCPECRAFFQLEQAAVRELPPVLLVDSPPPKAESEILESSSGSLEPAPEKIASADVNVEIAPEEVQPAAGVQSTAERIDNWFRSAKTLADAPPVDTSKTLAEVPDQLDADTDFQLDDSPEAPQSIAAWDDSPHMEQILADIEPPAVEKQSDGTRPIASQRHADYGDAIAATSAAELPMFSKKAKGKPRRKRSLLRRLTVTVLAGVVGSALGYYALLWLRGPSGDFLDVAQYLPAAMLPAELQPKPPQLAGVAPPAIEREAVPAIVEPEAETPLPAEGIAADIPAEVSSESAEVQASYTTTEQPPRAQAVDDRYGTVSPAGEASEQAAPFEESPAASMVEAAPTTPAAPIANAPSFSHDEFSVALQAAQEARLSLVSGSLADGREVQRAKAFGYSTLANLAETATFVDATANAASAGNLQQASDGLFREVLADAHARSEVAKIVPLWIDSPNRKHDGVFFAASLTRLQDAGAVTEYRGTMETGQSLTLLVPASYADQLPGTSRPLGVIGWIVEQPAQQVSDYTGQAQQAIWVSRLVPLP